MQKISAITDKRIIKSIICVMIISLCLCACAKKNGAVNTTSTDGSDVEAFIPNEDMIGQPFVIISVDTMLQQIMLKDRANGRQLLYAYNLSTDFMDKYGGYISITSFLPGRVCTIDKMDETGLISQISLSDEVWELENLENYNIDAERGVFTIGQTNYRIPEDVTIFSNSTQSEITDIGANDTLRLVGKDKDIWSMTVTTGHGMLSIINTQAFDGTLICIGDIYTLINGDMTLEVPEDTYNITVANNGYGGSASVEVQRGGQTTLDLDSIKTGGQKFCQLKFRIEVADAVIKVDGNPVKPDEVLSVAYGKHVLSVTAPGYESWTKYLFVNSETATIMLQMDEEGKSNNSKPNNVTPGGTTTSSSSSKTDSKKKDETELEYLTTIRDTVSSIMNSLGTM